MGQDGKDAKRVTATLTKTQFNELERLSEKSGVSMSWLVRKAIEGLLEKAAGGPMLPLDLK